MEQIQNNLRRAGLAKRELAQDRAMELGMKHPQLMEFDNQPEPTEPPMRGSGGDAGLARLVGRGKSKKSCGGTNGVMRGGFLGALASLALPLIGKLFGNGKMTKDAHDQLSTRLNGGMFGIPPLISMIGKLLGNGKMTKDAHDAIIAVLHKKNGKKNSGAEVEMSDSDSDSGKMSGGARHQGKMLGDHLVKLHGEGFFDDFAKGFMSVIKPFAGVASMLPGTIGTVGRVASGLMGNGKLEITHHESAMPKRGRGRPRKMCGGNAPHASTANAIGHARMSSVYDSLPGAGLGGSDVPPNGIAPVAYGNAPQAPASFKRNTVGMGRPRKALGADGHGMAPAPKMVGSGARSARGQLISKLMRENKGMTLGQASKHIKENGLM